MRNRLTTPALALYLLIQHSAGVYGQEKTQDPATPLNDHAVIVITVNPETRISVVRGDSTPTPARCGTPIELPVKIVNQGFLTAVLLATLVEPIPAGATLAPSEEPLTGRSEESRILRLTLREPGPADVSISFRARNDIPDLGGRDRIHLLAHCVL